MNLVSRIKAPLRRVLRAGFTVLLRLRSRAYVPATDARCVIIAPHPDDETLGCAGLIHRHRVAGLAVDIVYVTDGSGSHPAHPRLRPADLASLRRTEALRALRTLGVGPESLHFVGAVDGTLAHLSREEAESLSCRIASVLESLRPTVLLHPCRDDGSSEHAASHRLTLRALALADLHPQLLEYPVWARWSPLRLLRVGGRCRRVHRLSFPGLRPLKRDALAAYTSQIAPTPPWTQAVLPAGFVDCFVSCEEFFFEG